MQVRKWLAVGGAALAALGAGLLIKSVLPQRFPEGTWYHPATELPTDLPPIDVTFLRCGSVTIPELVAVRGALSLAPRTIAYSAVLIRHPQGLFLYDTGLCADIRQYLQIMPPFLRLLLGGFTLEESLASHLQQLNLRPADLDFALLSHLHWDHVGGIPDLPGVSLHINRVEYDAVQQTLFTANNQLIPKLMSGNPVELFDCNGPAYEGFHSSRDLFGDGSLILVPLPGHTAGNTGLFINRSNGQRLFLLGDAAWVDQNYLRPATMHPFLWSLFTTDDATARRTLVELHRFAELHPEVPLIAMHDARLQEAFMALRERNMVESR